MLTTGSGGFWDWGAAMSGDGSEVAYDDGAKTRDLWLVPADGSAPPRRITSTPGAESGAAWSPDSRRIAFSAKREGSDEPQIYLLDIAGGGVARDLVLTGRTVRAQEALNRLVPEATKDAYQRRFAHWRGSPPELVDTHPNPAAHAVIADEVVNAIERASGH